MTFNQIASAVIPNNQPRIVEIEIEATIDHIKVIPHIQYSGDSLPEWGSAIMIKHDDFRPWLKENSRMTFVHDFSDHTGAHQKTIYHIDYAEYLLNHINPEDVYDYLSKKGLVKLPFVQ